MRKITTLLFVATTASIFAQTQIAGPKSPKNIYSPGFTCPICPPLAAKWDSLTNAESDDGQFATASLSAAPSATSFSNQLFATKYGFTIPAGASILEITVGVKGMSGIARTVEDSVVSLTLDGYSSAGSNNASGTFWGTTNAYTYYAGNTNFWGLALTAKDIDSSSFGVCLSVKNTTTNTPTVSLDVIIITISYSTITGIVESQTRSVSVFSAYTTTSRNTLNVSFGLSKNSETKIAVYNVIGQVQFVKNLGTYPEGTYTESMIVPYLTPGIYFVKLSSNEEEVTRKIMVF